MKRIILSFASILFITVVNSQTIAPQVIATSGSYFEGNEASLSWTIGECVIETGKSMSEELAEKNNVSVSEIESSFEIAGELMYRAVRIGGKPCSRLPWRWGYGWPYCPLSIEENLIEEPEEE